MAGYYSVCPCGSVDCPGGCGPEEPNEAEELWGDTPEGMGWEPLDNPIVLAWESFQAAHDAECKARSEMAWARRAAA